MTAVTPQVVDFEGLRIEYDERVLDAAPVDRRPVPLGGGADPDGAARTGARALLRRRPHRAPGRRRSRRGTLVCVDADPAACSYLRRNAAPPGCGSTSARAGWTRSSTHDEQFAVIIADPPWVATGEVARFPEDPVSAIDGGADGLDLVRGCLDGHRPPPRRWPAPRVLQVGPDQADRVAQLVAGYDELAVIEVRELERGALVQIDRVAAAAA